ncbi:MULTISPECIES: phage major tail tube protein [unclassified Pseudovibrio]|uniref:phage major tail tube protein n=1 Tax=unclassified Pseudovibrio TaxID=2627060 RepID=UPI0007AEA1D6|nr:MULTISPECIES: phage major tail tube protein [unclassified Pseudovibrio]KZL02259.1 hypothetical protein PsW74_01357 [Pseudovibrio sp. W74]KZL08197.1 hypothetical protein PsAD14_03344 [Pseudovibrio sp. Ad14]
MQRPMLINGDIDLRLVSEPDESRANILSKLVLPAFKYTTVNHNPGGGIGAVDFGKPRTEAFEPKAEHKGLDNKLLEKLGKHEEWVFAGNYRQMPGNLWLPVRGFIYATLMEWEPDEMGADDLPGCNLAFKEVTHVELILDGKELFYWDFWEREMRPDPTDGERKRALGL